jgi:hypothetical protein
MLTQKEAWRCSFYRATQVGVFYLFTVVFLEIFVYHGITFPTNVVSSLVLFIMILLSEVQYRRNHPFIVISLLRRISSGFPAFFVGAIGVEVLTSAQGSPAIVISLAGAFYCWVCGYDFLSELSLESDK